MQVTARHRQGTLRRLLPAGLLLLGGCAAAAEPTADWFEDDAETRALAVNEGELVFLTGAPAGRVLQTRNRLSLDAAGLADGWLQLEQCQASLDPVPALEIVYRYRAIRDLRIVSFHGMERAWVEDGSVQMVNVGQDAEICIGAQVQVLQRAGEGRYEIRSGPFHRRFLDGYYPLALDYRLYWPAERLRLAAVEPPAQAGFAVERSPGELAITALFEGRLRIRVVLQEVGPPQADD